MTVGEAPPILLYTRFKVILPDSVSVSTACFPKEYPGSPNRCCPMMSVYFSKSMTGRTTEGGATASNSSVLLIRSERTPLPGLVFTSYDDGYVKPRFE